MSRFSDGDYEVTVKSGAGTHQYKNLKGARVDWRILCFDFLAACRERGVSMTRAGDEMGVNVATLSRLRHGIPLSVEALTCLITWLYPEAIPSWVRPVSAGPQN